jgi:uncharacterized membrane protein
MKVQKVLATLMGALIAGIGIVGVALPSVLLEFGQSLQTQGALYVVAAVRIVFGAVLIWVASASRMPRTLRVIGIFIIVAALLALLVGVEASQAMLGWFSSQGPLFMRAWASIAVVFGVFIVYAVNSSRRAVA